MKLGEYHIEVEPSMDNTIQEDYSMIKIIEVTLGEKILEEPKIIEVKILEVDIEVTLETTILEEVGIGLEKDIILVILEEMSKAVVGPDQVQE